MLLATLLRGILPLLIRLPLEAPLPSSATALEKPGRYASLSTFDQTLDFYRRAFRQGEVRWRTIVNLPSVKAKHVQSLKKETLWDGINVYEIEGRVYVYVLARAQGAKNEQKE